MMGSLSKYVLPESQKRSLEELTNELDMHAGDWRSKQSAYWIMLTFSSLIAGAGVLADSTATVIGAMIIAPLSTPIMSMALGLVKRERMKAIRFVVLGALLVVLVGVLFSQLLPSTIDLRENAQINGRVTPGLFDLLAAGATGFAGAIALARRDVASVLPGVAISISLVPPLSVVGVCLGQGSLWLAMGAALLFLSNLVSLVFAGTLVFAALGYHSFSFRTAGSTARARFALTSLLVVISIPLVATTGVGYYLSILDARIENVANEWASTQPEAQITSASLTLDGIEIRLTTPLPAPSNQQLLDRLSAVLPSGIPVYLVTTQGNRREIGTVPANAP